jgi:mannose-6-phosphate isomerase
MIEIQQNSDITYRLFDYGRPRELHLDAGLAVARGEPYDRATVRQLPENAAATLVDGPLFRLDCLSGPPDAGVGARYGGAVLVIPIDGAATIAGETVRRGDCALAPGLDAVRFAIDGRYLIAQPVSNQE